MAAVISAAEVASVAEVVPLSSATFGTAGGSTAKLGRPACSSSCRGDTSMPICLSGRGCLSGRCSAITWSTKARPAPPSQSGAPIPASLRIASETPGIEFERVACR